MHEVNKLSLLPKICFKSHCFGSARDIAIFAINFNSRQSNIVATDHARPEINIRVPKIINFAIKLVSLLQAILKLAIKESMSQIPV